MLADALSNATTHLVMTTLLILYSRLYSKLLILYSHCWALLRTVQRHLWPLLGGAPRLCRQAKRLPPTSLGQQRLNGLNFRCRLHELVPPTAIGVKSCPGSESQKRVSGGVSERSRPTPQKESKMSLRCQKTDDF